eukprot:TRINITY_DN43993_c0_g1_i1.p1 TRINITY_DN43993_c0_g1~~TRINITY_DN43993_c0_g1_i1.p1  ORF type:complete len:318 (+),score=34.88 TRINITY_DN43993_c0_g1_i1:74-1027(+)
MQQLMVSGLAIALVICMPVSAGKHRRKGNSERETEMERKPSIELVVAAYNEDLRWIDPMLARLPGAKLTLYCADEHHQDPRCIPVENVQSECPVYLHHIISKYSQLPDITVFAMGSAGKSEWGFLLCRKLNLVISKLDTLEKQSNFTGFATMAHTSPGEFLPFDPDFDLFSYRSHTGGAADKHCRPSISPLGKWYEHFVDRDIEHAKHAGVLYNDIFAVSAERIRKFRISTYKALHQEHLRCKGVRSTAGHYMERSWKAMYDDGHQAGEGPNECPAVIKSFVHGKTNMVAAPSEDDAKVTHWELTPPDFTDDMGHRF